MVRFNHGGKFVMKRAQHAANGKLVPRRALGMRSDIEGACRYYLRYRLPDGRRVYDPVGESSIETLAAANRKEIELFAALRSAEVAEPDAPQVAPSRVKVDNAIGQYLSNFASPDQRIDASLLLIKAVCGGWNVSELPKESSLRWQYSFVAA